MEGGEVGARKPEYPDKPRTYSPEDRCHVQSVPSRDVNPEFLAAVRSKCFNHCTTGRTKDVIAVVISINRAPPSSCDWLPVHCLAAGESENSVVRRRKRLILFLYRHFAYICIVIIRTRINLHTKTRTDTSRHVNDVT